MFAIYARVTELEFMKRAVNRDTCMTFWILKSKKFGIVFGFFIYFLFFWGEGVQQKKANKLV